MSGLVTREERRRRIRSLAKTDSAQAAVVALFYLGYGWKGAAVAFFGQWAWGAILALLGIWLDGRAERRAYRKLRERLRRELGL